MRNFKDFLLIGLLAACGQGVAAENHAVPTPSLPDRMLNCTLGRALNLDPMKNQTTDDIIYEGRHSLSVFLPGMPVRQSPPPDPSDPPEPVDPATRIVADPAGLTRGVPAGFDRVVDLWPKRVEMMKIIKAPLVNLIIISEIDETAGTANLFMTQATDAATMDFKAVYHGQCTVAYNAKRPGSASRTPAPV